MFSSIWEDLKREFGKGNMVTRLIIINVSVFVAVVLLKVIFRVSTGFGDMSAYDEVVRFFMISSSLWHDVTHPWVFLTSIFLHEGFWHILWNMLFLYWFGRIVGDLIGNRHILPLYLLGGLAGGIAFILSVKLLGFGGGGVHYALGASGAVMAIVVASAVVSPDFTMNLLLIGPVKLKYVVGVLVLLDVLAIGNDINTGGSFAHIGGALFGWLFVTQLRQGRDFGEPVNKLVGSIGKFFGQLRDGSKSSKGPRVVYRNKDKEGRRAPSDKRSEDHQERLDAILEKIKKNGYDNLTSDEKEFLFNASKK